MRLARNLAASAMTCAAIGCDRTVQLSDGSLADSVTEGSVARRTVPTAAAIQRVTGPISTKRALRELDSLLIVRVLDSRGAAMSGVPVRWSLQRAAAGADIRVIDATTDSLGLARAALTPGRSAVPQTVLANAPNAGNVRFTVTIPVDSARVVPDTFTVWAGDSVLVKAELLDIEGTPLSGGAVVWRADDMNVVRLSRVDATSVRVIGSLAGSATLTAWTTTGTTRASARVRVRGALMGRFIPLGRRSPPATPPR